MESSGCKSRTAQSSRKAGSECCHSPGDWWVRSVHSKEAGHEDSAPKTRLVAMPTLLTKRKAASGRPIMRGRAGVAGVPSSGHASKGISQEPRRAPHLLLTTGGTGSQGKPEATGIDGSAVLPTHNTREGGEPQGFRKERPRYPLEGRGEQADVSAEGNIDETQNSNCYVHKTRQTH